jgi:hypothetical protein
MCIFLFSSAQGEEKIGMSHSLCWEQRQTLLVDRNSDHGVFVAHGDKANDTNV